MKTFADFGIEVDTGRGGQQRTTCPQCSAQRTKHYEKCLSVNVDDGTWFCQHCGWTGGLGAKGGDIPRQRKEYKKPIFSKDRLNLPRNVIDWFAGRGISASTLSQTNTGFGMTWMHRTNGEVPCIQFPYYFNGEVVNIKHRGVETKEFRQEKDALKCFYRADVLKNTDKVIITEGEMDCLSLVECGFSRCCSVPDGAPTPDTKNYASKFDFLLPSEQELLKIKDIVLCVDNDAPGKKLEQELAKRLGLGRCWVVDYPAGCKDINDVLVRHGKEAVAQVLKNARPFPVEGIHDIGDMEERVVDVFRHGLSRGLSTGWENLDRFYTVKPGQWTVVTGIPGSGKSNFLDALMMNMTMLHGWRWAICSPENQPIERHVAALVEKHCRMPVMAGPGYTMERMREEDLVQSINLLRGYFHFVMPPEDEMTVDKVLDLCRVLVFRQGINGIIIDPWNEFDHSARRGSETEYISEKLSLIRRFARRNQVHIWVVAHPQKLTKDKDTGEYNPPSLYDISGSAHWNNKADNGVVVHRQDPSKPFTQVIVPKIRFKECGMRGMAEMVYVHDTGEYLPKPICDTVIHADRREVQTQGELEI